MMNETNICEYDRMVLDNILLNRWNHLHTRSFVLNDKRHYTKNNIAPYLSPNSDCMRDLFYTVNASPKSFLFLLIQHKFHF